MTARKGITDRAVDWLEEKGYLMSIRAEMKAEVMKSLVELEEAGEIPPSIRISRFTPTDDINKQAIAYVLEFLTFHKLNHSIICLTNEVNDTIETLTNEGENSSLIAQKIQEQIGDDGD
jgi:hypothetical protein